MKKAKKSNLVNKKKPGPRRPRANPTPGQMLAALKGKK